MIQHKPEYWETGVNKVSGGQIERGRKGQEVKESEGVDENKSRL